MVGDWIIRLIRLILGPKIVESLEAVHVVTIECGSDYTCALTDSGELYGWGDSSHGAEVLDN